MTTHSSNHISTTRTSNARSSRSAAIALVVSVAMALSACGGESHETFSDASADRAHDTTSTTSATHDQSSADVPAGTTFAARLHGAVMAYAKPSADAEVVDTVPATTEFGSASTLLVTDTGPDGWIEVGLPIRPNGTTGWIRSDDVTIRPNQKRVEITLDGTHLAVYDGDEMVLDTTVAIGSPENPTPRGQFFITDLIENENPTGAYGPFAIGLSAHSDTLSEFGGGDGQIGIHGTNQPASIGNAVSHGCVRAPNDLMSTLVAALPLGTPVLIA